jgi:hypothetical protein
MNSIHQQCIAQGTGNRICPAWASPQSDLCVAYDSCYAAIALCLSGCANFIDGDVYFSRWNCAGGTTASIPKSLRTQRHQ